MASSPAPAAALRPGHPRHYAPAVSPQPSGPPGSLPPGTLVKVGPYTVTVARYLSQGGFATVYLATTDRPVAIPSPDGTTRSETTHVLKRIVVPDKDALADVKREVEVHRMLRHDPAVVFFLEASALALPAPQQGYEVYILMEYCNGGGLLDLLNARLRNRLAELEILAIFADICKGVAAMHHLDPPIAHRDLKIENILLASNTTTSSRTVYKLCDFGSAKPVLSRNPPRSMEELKRLEMDLNKSTTLPYRPPEMVDVYQRRVIDEKADIWALGVLLYKLCYYTTPFEENGGGPLAILNVKYRFPHSPPYSDRVKGLIASLLVDPSTRRPSIDDVLVNVHRLMGAPPPKTALHYSQLAQAGKQLQPLPVVTNGSTSSRPVDDDVLVKIASSRRSQLSQHSPRPVSMAPTATHDLISFQSSDSAKPSAAAESKRIMDLEGVTPMRRGRPVAAMSSSSSSSSSPQRPASPAKNPSIGKLDLSRFEKSAGTSVKPLPHVPANSKPPAHAPSNAKPHTPAPAPAVGTLVEGFGDSFEPTPTSPPVAGTTNQGALAVKQPPPPPPQQLTGDRNPDASSRSRSPLKLSPALPGLAGVPSPSSSSAAEPPPHDSGDDDGAQGRFPSLEELDKRYPQPPVRKLTGTATASSTSLSKTRYDEARKTMGKRESMADIAGRFGGMGVGSADTASRKQQWQQQQSSRMDSRLQEGSRPTQGQDDRRPTPNLPPRKPVPKDWLTSSASPSVTINGTAPTSTSPSPLHDDDNTPAAYKSPARYGSKPTSPAVEKAHEEVSTVAAGQEIEQPSSDDDEEEEGDEGPEDVDGRYAPQKTSADTLPATTAQSRAPAWDWDAEDEADRMEMQALKPVGAARDVPDRLVDVGEEPRADDSSHAAVGSLSAANLLEEQDREASSASDVTTAAGIVEPSKESTAMPARMAPTTKPSTASAELTPAASNSTATTTPPQLIPTAPSKSSSADSATKGLPSRQRREMGKVYADAATSPRVASPMRADEDHKDAHTPKEYAPGTAQSMASRWESMGGKDAASVAAQKPAELRAQTHTQAPDPTPRSPPTRARPQVPVKPASLKPWEREAAERAEVEKYGHVRSARPATATAAADEQEDNDDGTLSPSNGDGGPTAPSQQQRYQSVASLIDKWQASSKSSNTPSGWGEIGGRAAGVQSTPLKRSSTVVPQRMPGRDV